MNVPNIGFSAYLKLICMNKQPQRTAIRGRLTPNDGNGYDFHRRLRLFAKRYLLDGEGRDDIGRAALAIEQEPERKSALHGLGELFRWCENNPGPYFKLAQVTFKSPGGVFNVQFQPDFGVVIDGKRTAVHIWNTKSVDIVPNRCYGALALLPALYAGQPGAPDDLAVLSLRDGTLYRLSEAGDAARFGLKVALDIEDAFIEEARDLGVTIGPSKHDPHAPPPPP